MTTVWVLVFMLSGGGVGVVENLGTIMDCRRVESGVRSKFIVETSECFEMRKGV